MIRRKDQGQAWFVLSVAFTLMALRRLVSLGIESAGATAAFHVGTTWQEAVSLATSAMLLAGVVLMRSFFRRAKTAAASATRFAVAFEKSELKYRFIVQHSTDGFVVLRGDRIIFASFAFEDIFGVSADATVGKGLTNLVAAEDRERLTAALNQLEPGNGATVVVECEIVRRGGERRWVRIMAQLSEWEEQAVAVLIISDTTESRSAELLLRQSEARHRAIVECQTELVCRFLPDGTVTFANDALACYYERTVKELIGLNVMMLLPPADRASFCSQLGEISRKEITRSIERRVVTKTGEVRWQQWTERSIHNDRGEIIEWQAVGRDVTDRVLVEQALRSAEERYRHMFDAGNAIRVLIDPDTGCVVDANIAASEFYGYSKEELRHPQRGGAVALLSREEAMRGLARARSRVHSTELTRHRCASGELRDVEIHSSPIELNGRVFLYSVIHDVTSRVETEQARDSLVRYLRTTAELSARLFAAKDPSAEAPAVVEALGRAAGADRCYWFAADEARDGPPTYSLRVEWQSAGVPSHLEEERFQNVDLGELPLVAERLSCGEAVGGLIDELPAEMRSFLEPFGLSSVLLIPMLAGARLRGVIGLDSLAPRRWGVGDTDLLRAGATAFALALDRRDVDARRRDLASIVEQATEAIALTDSRGYLRHANAAFLRASGLRSLQDLDASVRFLSFCPGFGALEGGLATALRLGVPWRGIVSDHRADDTPYTAQTTVFPLFDAAGEVTGCGVVQLDVSKQVGLEQQLFRTQKLEALGSFASGIAHDFNNFTTVALNATSLLERQCHGDEQAMRELAIIRRAANGAGELTRGLLAFARRQLVSPTAIEPAAVLFDALPMLRRIIPEHIDLQTAIDPEAGAAIADAGLIEQAVMNLCVNARDAMPGGGTLTLGVRPAVLDDEYVASHPWATAGRYVALTVEDTGTGIVPEALPRLFDPFFTTKEQGKGTGLGLAIVYGVAKQLGGCLDVESALGRGSRFTLYVPAATRPAAPRPPARTPRSLEGSERVLVVEDHEDLRDLVARCLGTYGYEVVTARNGEEALAVLESGAQQVDAVVTDLIMPRMGGGELADVVRDRWPHLGVIVATGFAGDDRSPRLTSQPRLACIAKPYEIDHLVATLRDLLEDRTSGLDGR